MERDSAEAGSRSAAILYGGDWYSTAGERLWGRQVAAHGFLKALCLHGTTDPICCVAYTEDQFRAFVQQVESWTKDRELAWLRRGDFDVGRAGTLYVPDTFLGKFGWQRRFHDQRAFSICGVNHTLSDKQVFANLGELVIAPMQRWDALVCTSEAAKRVIEKTFEDWAEYLAARIGTRPSTGIELPVIPLGVDCSAIPTGDEAVQLRARLRGELDIPDEDIVVLFVGRLACLKKAHPVPMYMAVERAAQRTGRPVHLLHVGWFESEAEGSLFHAAARAFCPSVRCHFVDGRQPEVATAAWKAGDIFVSLSDNVQESFGLTPIEAMANGLPAIVSDWNGYRDTIRHEIDGLRIPTTAAPAGTGPELARLHAGDVFDYTLYQAHACMATAVDVDACAEALASLIANPELRGRMGASGLSRAREVYDWKNVVGAYEDLWDELGKIRASASESAPVAPDDAPHPLCQDPFSLFAEYASDRWDGGATVALGGCATPDELERLSGSPMVQWGSDHRLPTSAVTSILDAIGTAGRLSIDEVLAGLSSTPAVRQRAFRTLLHLLKFDILRAEDRA